MVLTDVEYSDLYTLTGAINRLSRIIELLLPSLISTRSAVPGIVVAAISGASTATQINATKLLVKAALVQNISTNPVSLGTDSNLIVGKGHILNAASASGSAGDTTTIVPPQGYDTVDLSLLYFNQTGTGDTLSVFYFL